MIQKHFFYLLTVLAMLVWSFSAWAAEQASTASPAPPVPVIGQQGIVLGQPATQQVAPVPPLQPHLWRLLQDIKETVNSSMLAFLDHVPPAGAVRLRMEPALDKVQVWKLGDAHYIRTSHTLMWPAWTASVNGAGNMKCYEVQVTSRVMLSIDGTIQTLVLKESTPADGKSEVKP